MATVADVYYKTASEELQEFVKYTSQEFIDWLRNNRGLRESFLTFSWPIDFQMLKNMYDFYQHFGAAKILQFPNLFLGIAYQRRDIGVKSTPLMLSFGLSSYYASSYSKDQLDQMSSLTEGQLRNTLAEEADGLEQYIAEEELHEKVGVMFQFNVVKAYNMIHLGFSYFKDFIRDLKRPAQPFIH